jgi:oligopeptide/dipeptide ABC transporter ATP-binding protein
LVALLKVSGLTVHFDTEKGKVQALDNFGISLGSGEVMALVGESGSGKTTLARAILNIVPAPSGNIEAGQVLFKGQNILKMGENECNANIRGKSITIIPQDPFASANPLFTIRTQLKDILKSSSVNEEDINLKITETLSRLQLPIDESLLRKYPHELSGGQLQRIMIAAALLPSPSLIIADEPTTSLDVTVEAQILQLFRHIVKEHQVTVLYITHNLAVASKVSDKITVVYAGQVMESAPIDIFFNNTAHPYAKKLLECLPNPEGKIKDIGGFVPNLIDPPSGCRFHPRCEYADSQCVQDRPHYKEIEPEHWVSCYR